MSSGTGVNFIEISKDHGYVSNTFTDPMSYEATLVLKLLYLLQTHGVKSIALKELGM